MKLSGPTLLLQDGEVTILFPLVEGMQITLNHPEVLLVSEMVREVDKYILPVMIMLMTTITMEMEMEMEMDIMNKLNDLPMTFVLLVATWSFPII